MAKTPAMSRYEEIRDSWQTGPAAERKAMVEELGDMLINSAPYHLTTEDRGKVAKLRVQIDPSAKWADPKSQFLIVEIGEEADVADDDEEND